MGDYEKTYNDFWKDLVEDDNGSLNRDKVMRELADYHNVMQQVSLVYDDITGGRISKPNTMAFEVIGVAQERIDEIVNEEIRGLSEGSSSSPSLDSSTEKG